MESIRRYLIREMENKYPGISEIINMFEEVLLMRWYLKY